MIREAISDMKNDGVWYVEFRVTLKKMPTKRCFLILLEEEMSRASGIEVRLIVSVARHESLESASESADLAIDFFKAQKSNILVGFELCGNPNIGEWNDFRPIFQRCKQAGLKIALHFAENHMVSEHHAMLDFFPDRLGHAVFANPDILRRMRYMKKRIPVETCLSCHEEFYKVPIPNNVFKTLFPWKYPISLNSDNPLLQSTIPSIELAKALDVFSGRLINTKDDFVRLIVGPFEHAFGNTKVLRDKAMLEIEQNDFSLEWMRIARMVRSSKL